MTPYHRRPPRPLVGRGNPVLNFVDERHAELGTNCIRLA